MPLAPRGVMSDQGGILFPARGPFRVGGPQGGARAGVDPLFSARCPRRSGSGWLVGRGRRAVAMRLWRGDSAGTPLLGLCPVWWPPLLACATGWERLPWLTWFCYGPGSRCGWDPLVPWAPFSHCHGPPLGPLGDPLWPPCPPPRPPRGMGPPRICVACNSCIWLRRVWLATAYGLQRFCPVCSPP